MNLEIAVDYGSFVLVETCDGLACIAEDLERFLFAEARLQALIHEIHHLTSCPHTNTKFTISFPKRCHFLESLM